MIFPNGEKYHFSFAQTIEPLNSCQLPTCSRNLQAKALNWNSRANWEPKIPCTNLRWIQPHFIWFSNLLYTNLSITSVMTAEGARWHNLVITLSCAWAFLQTRAIPIGEFRDPLVGSFLIMHRFLILEYAFARHRNRLQVLQSPFRVSTSQPLIVVDCVIWWGAECRRWGLKPDECGKQVLTRIPPGWLPFCETLNPVENFVLQLIGMSEDMTLNIESLSVDVVLQ